jgi:hypothetical protein
VIGKQKRDIEFVKEVNFEVRLQDMNRFYAFMTSGHPIMTPVETLQALVMLGEKPDPKVVKSIMDRHRLAVSEAEIADVLATTRQGKDGEFGAEGTALIGGEFSVFTVARRLVTGLEVKETQDGGEAGSQDSVLELESGLRSFHGKAYEAYLERVLIEAPGHI